MWLYSEYQLINWQLCTWDKAPEAYISHIKCTYPDILTTILCNRLLNRVQVSLKQCCERLSIRHSRWWSLLTVCVCLEDPMDPHTAAFGSLNGFSAAGTKQQPSQCSPVQPSPSLLTKIPVFLVLAHTWIHTQMKQVIRVNEARKHEIF